MNLCSYSIGKGLIVQTKSEWFGHAVSNLQILWQGKTYFINFWLFFRGIYGGFTKSLNVCRPAEDAFFSLSGLLTSEGGESNPELFEKYFHLTFILHLS